MKKSIILTDIPPKRLLFIRIFGFTFLASGLSIVVLIIYSMQVGYK